MRGRLGLSAGTSTAQVPTAGRGSRPTSQATGAATKAPRLRIAIVGDSLAQNLGVGMLGWAKGSDSVVVKNFSMSGCPLALGGMRRWPDGYELPVRDECSWFVESGSSRWKDFQAFDPQVIVMQDGMNELVERRLDEWKTYYKAGQPTFDEWLLGEYRSAFDIFNPQGTRQLLQLNAVCADWDRVRHFEGFQPELDLRVASLNRDYAQLSAPNRTLVDLDEQLCPGGTYTDTVAGVSNGRYDGYHLTEDASIALATQWLGPLSIEAGKGS